MKKRKMNLKKQTPTASVLLKNSYTPKGLTAGDISNLKSASQHFWPYCNTKSPSQQCLPFCNLKSATLLILAVKVQWKCIGITALCFILQSFTVCDFPLHLIEYKICKYCSLLNVFLFTAEYM